MSRKTITVITMHLSPENSAAAQRMDAAVKALSASYNVHVVTSSGTKKNAANPMQKIDEHITIHDTGGFRFSKYRFINFLNRFFLAMRMLRKANSISCDLVFVTSPFVLLLPLVARNINARRKVADVRDLSWNYLPANGFIQKTIKKRLIRWMHRQLNKFDRIIVTNESEKKWLYRYSHIDSAKISVIPHGVARNNFLMLKNMKSRHDETFRILWAGNINTSNNTMMVIDAVKGMKNVHLNIIGDDSNLLYAKKYIATNNIKNVQIIGRMPWPALMRFYRSSHLLFASLEDNFETCIPSCLYEYLATGLPVLFHGSGAAAGFLMTFKNSFVSIDNSSKSLEKLIWRIRKLAPERSEKNIQFIETHFLRERQSIRFTEIISGLLNDRVLSATHVEDILANAERNN